jgi:hypothetical protein
MSFARTLDLFIDADRPGGQPCLLDGLQGALRAVAPTLMQGDDFDLRLFFRRAASGLYAETTELLLDAGAEIILAAKADPDEEALLFSASGFTAGEDDALGAFYRARLSLATEALDEALAEAGADGLDVLVDVEVQDAGNERRLTFRFTATVGQQVYAGEADPAPAEPQYPAPSALMLKNPPGGNYRFKDGNIQLWNPVTEKWHTFFPHGPEGSVVSAWGEGED